MALAAAAVVVTKAAENVPSVLSAIGQGSLNSVPWNTGWEDPQWPDEFAELGQPGAACVSGDSMGLAAARGRRRHEAEPAPAVGGSCPDRLWPEPSGFCALIVCLSARTVSSLKARLVIFFIRA